MSSDTARREFLDKVALARQQFANIPKIREEIARAKRAKIDVSAEEEKLNEIEAKLDAFLAEYG
jgi:hypothetical protein